MTSISDSIHQLLADQIKTLGLSPYFEVESKCIYGKNGSEIRFAGLKTNVNAVRSYERIDICFVEEAQNVSKSSWDTLLPTIRAPDSEVWVCMNPDLETDNSYVRWIKDPPKSAWVARLNWQDNPWFPEVLKAEMLDMKERSYHDYLHIWEGHCRAFLTGAVYYDQLVQCEQERRIRRVIYDPMAPVEAFLDLGWADATSIWLCQRIPGGEVHCIDYHENTRKPLDYYLKYLSDKPYAISTIWLPHDARAKNLGTGRSIEELIRMKGHAVRIVPNLSLTDGINALRELFPKLWFDKDNCEEGLQALRHYRYDVINDGAGGFKNAPVHDRWSHGADSARYIAIALKQPKSKNALKYDHKPFINGTSTSWMQL
jgi:phage terminase large subunit